MDGSQSFAILVIIRDRLETYNKGWVHCQSKGNDINITLFMKMVRVGLSVR